MIFFFSCFVHIIETTTYFATSVRRPPSIQRDRFLIIAKAGWLSYASCILYVKRDNSCAVNPVDSVPSQHVLRKTPGAISQLRMYDNKYIAIIIVQRLHRNYGFTNIGGYIYTCITE